MIALLFLLLLFSPFLSSLFCLFLLKKFYRNNIKSQLIFLFIGLSIGVLNALKVPENDLLNYIIYFENAGKFNFLDYLMIEGKEYVFFISNYVLFYLLGGSFNLYIVLLTSIGYYCIFYAIRVLDQYLKLGYQSYLLAIIVTLFFPNLFSLSAHLIRQFLAMSIIIVFIVKNIFEGNKKSIIYFALAFLIHSSSLFFMILFLPGLNKKITFFKGILYSGVILGFLFLINIYGVFFQKVPLLGYVLYRFLNKENAIWETDNLGILSILIQLIVLILFYFGLVKNKYITDLKVYKLFYLTVLLVFFILSNYNNTEIATRFNFYIYPIFCLSFYFFFSAFNIHNLKIASAFCLIFLLVFTSWFFFKVINGTWVYNNFQLYIFTFL